MPYNDWKLMKKQFIAALGLVLFGSAAFGQTNSMSYQAIPRASMPTASQGVRVAILKPFLDVGISVGGNRISIGEAKSTAGFSIGYANLPIQQLGFTTNIAYLGFSESDNGIARLDGSLAYAMNEIVDFKGGLNLSKVTGFQEPSLNAGLGLQAGAGFQITRNFGIDAGITMMRQTLGDAAMDETGLELGVHGTF